MAPDRPPLQVAPAGSTRSTTGPGRRPLTLSGHQIAVSSMLCICARARLVGTTRRAPYRRCHSQQSDRKLKTSGPDTARSRTNLPDTAVFDLVYPHAVVRLFHFGHRMRFQAQLFSDQGLYEHLGSLLSYSVAGNTKLNRCRGALQIPVGPQVQTYSSSFRCNHTSRRGTLFVNPTYNFTCR